MLDQKTLRDLAIITFFVLISTFLIWLPHILALPNFWGLNFSNGFNTIYRNFDGLEYVVIAKTFYDPGLIAAIPQPLPASYYPSHFPLFPIFIALFAPALGFLKSMLFVSILFTILSAIAFYLLLKDFKLTSSPLLLTIIFLLLPARWLIVRSVGSPEPMFIFFIILSLYFLLKVKDKLNIGYISLSAVFASFAQLARPPGILFAVAIGLYVLWQGYKKRSLGFIFSFFPFILVPLTLLSIFYLFQIQLGNFWAYFGSGDNIHLIFPPFQAFNLNQYWIGSIWLEDIVYIFILGLLGGVLLFKQKLYPFSFFVLTYLFASFFVAHRDISRYTLAVAPFILMAFEKILVSREFKIVLFILALAIYLYSQNYIINNVAPVADVMIYD